MIPGASPLTSLIVYSNTFDFVPSAATTASSRSSGTNFISPNAKLPSLSACTVVTNTEPSAVTSGEPEIVNSNTSSSVISLPVRTFLPSITAVISFGLYVFVNCITDGSQTITEVFASSSTISLEITSSIFVDLPSLSILLI